MARYTSYTQTQMTFHGWLTLYEDGEMKLTRGEPAAGAGARLMKLDVKVPRSVFQTPQLKATVEISDQQNPVEITADVVGAAEDALKAILGCQVRVGEVKHDE